MKRTFLGMIALLLLSASLARAQGLPPVPVPPGNPITPQKTLLGKALFWDEQLSSTRSVACATCHRPEDGGSDPRSTFAIHPGFDGIFGGPDDVHGSFGVVANLANGAYIKQAPFELREQVTGRKAPSMINAAYPRFLMWDGSADETFRDPITGNVILPDRAALESQSVGPPLNTAEMAHIGRDWPDIVERVEFAEPLALARDWPIDLVAGIQDKSYPDLFAEAFGSPQVTPARIAMAIATYERTLISDDAPIDRFLDGDDGALTPQQRRGFNVFNRQGRCDLCHNGPLFTNNQFVNIGVRPPQEDRGRANVTGRNQDRGRFKVPGLRNVGLRAPYFHNGAMQSLEDVVEFYDRGGDFADNRDNRIIPLGLSPPMKADLVAFLRFALTDARVRDATGPFSRPTLFVETNDRPEQYGDPKPGTGGVPPRFQAVEPSNLGNPNVTLTLAEGLGGAPALVAVDLAPAPPGTYMGDIPIHVGLTPSLMFVAIGNLREEGPGEGYRSLMFDIPADPALDDVDVYLQGFVLDPGATSSIASTSGLHLSIFASER